MNSLIPPPRVAVLLSTFNGEKYLSEMLKSICNQEKVEVELFVRDDGSTDATLSILKGFTNRISLNISSGENIGSTKSFIALLEKSLNDSREFQYFAFADQDDIWATNKLISKYAFIAKEKSPSLAFCRQEYFQDTSGTYPKGNFFHPNAEIPFFQNPIRGCTMLFNRALATKIIQLNSNNLIKHDFAVYVCAKLYGNIFYTGTIGMKYRIHPGNEIGISSFRRKIQNLGTENKKLIQAVSVIETLGPGKLGDEDFRVLTSLTSQETSLISRVRFVIRNRVLRQGWLGNNWWRLKIVFKIGLGK